MIAETKHPHPRWLEDRVLVRSTQSYHFATIRFATSCNATVNRLVGLLDPPFGIRQPTARSIRFGSLWAIIHTKKEQSISKLNRRNTRQRKGDFKWLRFV
jgi:hypothetical protein